MNQRTLERLAIWVAPMLVVVLFAFRRPFFFTNPLYLSGFIVAELVLVSLWHYQSLYFPLTIIFFVAAGTSIPFAGLGMTGRWPVLAVGALVGAAVWLRGRRQSFTELHLVAFLCVPIAAVSAVSSNDPTTALLKVLSLALLFLYGATGARLAMSGREEKFIRGVLLACEINLLLCALTYPVGWALWGNPNSLGAITAVVMVPFLLWGFLIAKTRTEKYRRGGALLVCLLLLFVALSRASLLAAAVASIALLTCLRRQRLLIEGAFLIVLVMAVVAVLAPTPFERLSRSLTSDVIYKGKKEQGVWGSRQTPWQETVASLQQHPWFGTGFGTSSNTTKGSLANVSLLGGIYTLEGTNREHGNSYLALAEYLGFLGMIPFVALLALILRMIVQVCLWMRRTGNPYHPAIPLAMVLLAGLVHAFFEDWLIAVGYYLCVFFWVSVFLLDDLRPDRGPLRLGAASPAHPRASAPVPGFAAPTR